MVANGVGMAALGDGLGVAGRGVTVGARVGIAEGGNVVKGAPPKSLGCSPGKSTMGPSFEDTGAEGAAGAG